MKLFEKKTPEAYTVIVGCGRLGANIANQLSGEGENVLIIDENREAFRRLSSGYGGLTTAGNGADLEVLREAGVDRADVVIAVTNDDNVNILVAQLAKKEFNVQRVIARLYDSEREDFFKGLGINTICPATLSVKEIDKLLGGETSKEACV